MKVLQSMMITATAVFVVWLLFVDRATGFEHLIPEPPSPPNFTQPAPTPTDDILLELNNPVGPDLPPPPPPPFTLVLAGVLTSSATPHGGVVFLKSARRGADLMAWKGQGIRRGWEPEGSLAGWRLVKVWKDGARFSNGSRSMTLKLGEDASRHSRVESYDPDAFDSRLVASAANREVWALDPREAAWVSRNTVRILDRDLRVTPLPGKGVKIDWIRAGSIVEARGLKPGDFVRALNGRPVGTLSDLKATFPGHALPRQGSVRVSLERQGRTIHIDYRLRAR